MRLGEVAEIEAQMFSFAQKFNRRTAVELSTEPAILPNRCYRLGFFSRFFVFIFKPNLMIKRLSKLNSTTFFLFAQLF
ncbi:MAG: hypothetical protein JSS98_15165 [Bacteroidetes bacterium]|nr:hypothetical protein [Bacteroidota bacterium]